ncbi:MAG: hypothetical protein KatS3mg011_2004 [Acidimicrobiia bacterium]|nr:MAG: hypothetical protein KatS3mg011_2004 [Acidimicrobiia bacterium]
MTRWAVVRSEEVPWEEDPGRGMRSRRLAGPDQGAVHLEVALVELAPGGTVAGHLHPYEESFYILDGQVAFRVAEQSHALQAHDYGFAPLGVPHSWHNPHDRPARWLRIRSPQPRTRAGAASLVPDYPLPEPERASGRPRYVGRFDPSSIPGPGPIQLKGFRSPGPTNVGLSMLIDEVNGAVHHTLFVVEFHPTGPELTLGGAHYHPFEETYYIIEGEAVAHLEDQSIPVGVGDLVFAGVNALHGFSNTTDRPVRWIEAQGPAPPPSGSFFFPADWEVES